PGSGAALVPAHGRGDVFGDALPVAQHLAEIVLCGGVPRFGGRSIELETRGFVLGSTETPREHPGEVVLRIGMILRGRETIPMDRLRVVLRHAETLPMETTEAELRVGGPSFGHERARWAALGKIGIRDERMVVQFEAVLGARVEARSRRPTPPPQ